MSDAILLAVSAIGFLAICAVILRVGDWLMRNDDDETLPELVIKAWRQWGRR